MAEKESTLINKKPDNTLAFRAAVSQMIGNIAESVGEDVFGKCQTFLKSQVPDSKFPLVVRKLHTNLMNDLKKTMNEELNTIMDNEDFVDGLGKLKNLMTEASCDPNQKAWRPPGDVSLHLRTPDAVKIDEETATLSDLVEQLENDNRRLKKEITQIRKNIQKMHQKITKSTNLAASSFTQMQQTQNHMQKRMDDLDHVEVERQCPQSQQNHNHIQKSQNDLDFMEVERQG